MVNWNEVKGGGKEGGVIDKFKWWLIDEKGYEYVLEGLGNRVMMRLLGMMVWVIVGRVIGIVRGGDEGKGEWKIGKMVWEV